MFDHQRAAEIVHELRLLDIKQTQLRQELAIIASGEKPPRTQPVSKIPREPRRGKPEDPRTGRIAELAAEGKKPQEIQAEVGGSVISVRSAVKRLRTDGRIPGQKPKVARPRGLGARTVEIIDLVKAGKTRDEIHAELGGSIGSIDTTIWLCRKRGLLPPLECMERPNGGPRPFAGAKRGEKGARIVELANAGKTAAEIHADVGGSINAVYSAMHAARENGLISPKGASRAA